MKANCCGRLLSLTAGVLAIVGAAALPCAMAASTGAEADAPTALRVSPSQYKLAIADIFGGSIKIDGSFEPEQRDQGLLAIGERTANVTDSGLDSSYDLAQNIAAQVVDPQHRDVLVGCKPRSEMSRDDDCARAFFAQVEPLLYRRPLTTEELDAQVAVAGMAADRRHNFYSGISDALAELLISPEFLFRYKTMEPDPEHAGQERMTAYSKATELSYFLWNTTPDEELLEAAKSGELQTQAGLEKQVNRMIGSGRVKDSVRAFFADMLSFDNFDAVSKDPSFFPLYVQKIKDEAQEQTLRTIVDHIVTRHGDYRDLFTTPHTFLTDDLAALYGVPLTDTTDNAQPQPWLPYTYQPGDPHAGILSEASFTSLWSPAGRSSPTIRGKALRMNILCEKVPPPPGNVSFKFVDDTTNPDFKTARDRLTAHRANPVCAGCHKLTDPLGLALENFDAAGGFRSTENGATIDTSGELSGHQFVGPLGLGEAVHDDPAATGCVTQRLFAFETGYLPPKDDPRWQQIQQKFAASHYDVVELLRTIALSDLSYSPPSTASKVLSAAIR